MIRWAGAAARIANGVLLLVLWLASVIARADTMCDLPPPTYPHSLQRELREHLTPGLEHSDSVPELLHVAWLYMNIADDLLTDDTERITAYEQGARFARRALELEKDSADAHFLYAANLGSAARLKGVAAGALALEKIKTHTARAIELEPDHAPALQLMGGLLANLPWVLGGDTDRAIQYLKRAIEADDRYSQARLILAKIYIDRNQLQEAVHQLRALIETDCPHYRYTWEHRFKPEAQRLLDKLEDHASPSNKSR